MKTARLITCLVIGFKRGNSPIHVCMCCMMHMIHKATSWSNLMVRLSQTQCSTATVHNKKVQGVRHTLMYKMQMNSLLI